MSLPRELLRTRLVNELAMCRDSLHHDIRCSDEGFCQMPVSLDIVIRDVPGPVLKGGEVVDRTEHGLRVIITENYPYEKPIVRWQTPIFHPNIMLPRDGGYVCTKLLDSWSFVSNLLSFIKGVESLLSNPNPMSPYKTDSCMLASERFLEEPYRPRDLKVERRLPRVVG
jgi:hypothetical protein